jgi:DNA polymerase-3 subunit delta
MRVAADAGDSVEFLMKRSGIHFSREKAVGEALRRSSAQKLARAMQQLAEAAFEARRNAPLAEAIAQRALLSVAMGARRRDT